MNSFETDKNIDESISKKEILRNIFTGQMSSGKNLCEIGIRIYGYVDRETFLEPIKEINGVTVLASDWTHELFHIVKDNKELRDKIWGDYDNFYRVFNSYFSIKTEHWEEFFEKALYPVFDKYFK